MKLTVDSAALNKALKIVSPAMQQNVVMPILECVLIEGEKNSCTITATTLNLTIKQKFKCECSGEFKMVLPFKQLLNITSVIAIQPITIEYSDNHISIGGKHKVAKRGEPKDFPTIEQFEPDLEMDADEEFLYNLQLATNCITKNPVQVQFLNVSLDFKDGKLQIMSTDAMQLFRYEQNHKQSFRQTNIDAGFVKAFKNIQSGKLYANDKFLKLENDTTTIIAKLSEQKFPDCSLFFTDYKINCSIKRQDLLQALNEITVFDVPLFDVSFFFVPDGIRIKFDDNEFDCHFDDTIHAEHSVEIEKVRLNAALLKNLLSLIPESETVNLYVQDFNKKVHIDPENKNQKLIIVPLFNI